MCSTGSVYAVYKKLTPRASRTTMNFQPPVKVGLAGEPGYCYGLDTDGLGTATRHPTLTVVCGTEAGNRYTATGGDSWLPVVPGELGKGTINELFHMANGTLRTVQVGRANPDNASWSGQSLGFWFWSHHSGGAVLTRSSNRTTHWTGLPRPSRDGHIRLHQQGSLRVPISACTTPGSLSRHDGHDEDGSRGCRPRRGRRAERESQASCRRRWERGASPAGAVGCGHRATAGAAPSSG